MKKQQLIAFTADKNGKPLAFVDSRVSSYAAWRRIGYDEAKLRIATGRAREVKYTR